METLLRVLIVEDSEADSEILLSQLRHGGYEVLHERVESAAAMVTALEHHEWDLIISDHALPSFNSLAALRLVQEARLDLPFIIVSGSIGEETAVETMKAGASDYVLKGNIARLLPAVARELKDAQERRARRRMERELREREQRAALELAAAYETTLDGWARALDLRDHETEGHSRRVTDLTLRLAATMGMSEAECVHVRRGALLHDIGKLAIPDRILLKPSALDPDEWAIMRRHPMYAFELLAPIDYLRPALDIPYCHHEKWDGTGYPRRLKGSEIPLAARIFAAADIWDAVRSDRAYRGAWSLERARDLIGSLAGTHLEPAVAVAFLGMLTSLDGPDGGKPTDHSGDTRLGATILIVDDFEANVNLLKRWLMADGYNILTANSGESALAAVAEHHPDLVLLDIMIPHPNGLAVCQRLKEDATTRDTPVIFMSAVQDTAVHVDARHFGAEDFLPKPIDAYELRRRIRRVLDHVRATLPSIVDQ